jgi:ParB/RepB/Spo0J family partition protein
MEETMQKKHTKKAVATDNGNDELRLIPLSEIEPTTDNVRKKIDPKKFAELVKSVKAKGVLQPILVRPIAVPNGAAKYQIIAGERRYRAATEAGLTEIPAYIKVMSDEDALSACLMENLLREDVHPLDEADGFLRLNRELKLDVRTIAARVAKEPRYVARRLPLTSLIEEARDDLRQERITLGHALEICRLALEIQPHALAACYETKSVRSKDRDGYDFVPDKTKPPHSVRHLQEWLVKNVHLNLQTAPFKLDDPRLRDDSLTCINCPQRTGHDKLLFSDIRDSDTCLNRICFSAKYRRWLDLIKAEVEAKQGKPTVFISAHHGWRGTDEGTLSLDQYQPLEKRADRCEYAEQAVYDDGVNVGKVQWICREPSCKDHLGRVREVYTPVTNGAPPADTSEARHARKQELFDIKVDELVRKRVMAEALKTFTWPLERKHLDEVVKEFFRRIPTDVQKTICEVFGWDKQFAGKLAFDNAAVLAELAKLDYHQLARFLMLCSFAHYGANEFHNRRVDQSAVVTLSKACNVNHALIDAQARLELSPKKYKEAHQTYLKAVQSGKSAEKPVVYEQTAQIHPAAAQNGKAQTPDTTSQADNNQKAAKAVA